MRGKPLAERRQFGRRWCRVHGWICVDGGPRVACRVTNFSEGGALLEIDHAFAMPDRFRLIIDAVGFDVLSEIRHRRGGVVGVSFVPEARDHPEKIRIVKPRSHPRHC